MNKRIFDNIVNDALSGIIECKRKDINPNIILIPKNDFRIIKERVDGVGTIPQNICSHDEFMGLRMYQYSGNEIIVTRDPKY